MPFVAPQLTTEQSVTVFKALQRARQVRDEFERTGTIEPWLFNALDRELKDVEDDDMLVAEIELASHV